VTASSVSPGIRFHSLEKHSTPLRSGVILFHMENSRLVEAAALARANAHAPYSNFAVGAALECEDGTVFTGCNVENLSFGLTMCAERVAIGAAVAAGQRAFRRIAVVAATDVPISPCGACRQVMAEFHPALKILSATLDGKTEELALAQLLPRASTGILNRP
jgi:cytidine deaminase